MPSEFWINSDEHPDRKSESRVAVVDVKLGLDENVHNIFLCGLHPLRYIFRIQ
jgi:hypothetical protein